MMASMRRFLVFALILLPLAASGCATLGLGIQAPRFSISAQEPSEFRLLGPSLNRPLGGAAVRLYARVENPNPVGITLSGLTGTLSLEGFEAADADFPLGVPLQANESAVVPLDINVSFSSLPGVAEVVSQAFTRGSVSYALDGVATVDAGVLGPASFGPMRILSGALDTRR
jgi:hypothetical protein